MSEGILLLNGQTVVSVSYRVGLGKIYTEQDREKARASPSFAQEYEIQYGGSIGNLLREQNIQRALSQTILINWYYGEEILKIVPPSPSGDNLGYYKYGRNGAATTATTMCYQRLICSLGEVTFLSSPGLNSNILGAVEMTNCRIVIWNQSVTSFNLHPRLCQNLEGTLRGKLSN